MTIPARLPPTRPRGSSWGTGRRWLTTGGTDTLCSLADQILVSAMGFALTVQIGRFGQPSDLGFYALAMSVAWLVIDAFTGLVICPFTLRRHTCAPQDIGTLRSTALAQCVAVAAGVGVIYGAAFGGFVGSGAADAMPSGTLLPMAFAAAAVVLREQTRRVRAAELDVVGAFGLDLRVFTMLLVGAGTLVAAGLYSFPRLMGVVAVAFAVPGALWCGQQIRRHPVSLAAVGRSSVASWQAGRWIFLSGFVWTAVTYAYPWLLARQHGLAASGNWAAMMSLVAIAGVPISGIQNYGGVRILAATGRPDGLTREVLQWSGFSIGVSACFAAALWFGGDSAVRAVFGPAYAQGGPVVVLLAANLAAAAGSFPFSRALFALNAAHYDATINMAALALLLPASWVTAEYGVPGAACALTATSAACFLARVITYFVIVREAREAEPAGSGTCDAPA